MTIRVVLADDQPKVGRIIRNLLSKDPGIDVIEQAFNGADAVHLIHFFQPEVAIIDVRMPDMSGIEVVKQLAKSFCKTKVLGLSMHADESYVKAMIDAGACGYVLKEDAAGELSKAVRAVHVGKVYFSRDVQPQICRD